MSITQIVEVPIDRKITLPQEVPVGKASIIIQFPVKEEAAKTSTNIDEIRQLMQKEMAEQGTASIKVENGDGWEAHVKERYA